MADRTVNLETVIGMVNTYFRNILNLNPDLLIDGIVSLPSVDSVEVVRCKDCKNSEHWYADRRRCFLWHENGVSVFDGGFCNYGERKDGEHEKAD